jgi:hypothetical protein
MMFGTNSGSNETWKLIPQNSIGVELGVWKGDSSEKFLQRARHIHLVDPWSVTPYKDSDEFGDYDGYLTRYSKLVGSRNPADFQSYYDNIAESVKLRFKAKPVTIHRCTTDDFFSKFKEKVDWVYVDALHSYDGCLSDLRKSREIINAGGFIIGDDYGNKEGVVRAVDQFIRETGLVLDNFFKSQYRIFI